MTSKHTPGPWVVHDHPTCPYKYGHHVTTADALTVCSVTYQLPVRTPHGVEEATRVANARLIAAAPELLEVIRICLDAELARKKKLLPGAPATTYTQARIDRINAVLTKVDA